MLFGVDDGASDEKQMYEMLEQSYRDGVRAICLTPHFSPYLYGNTFEKSEQSFAILREYAEKNFPDMQLYLGHELGYHNGAMEALRNGSCRSLAGSRYVLVDFPERVDFFEITSSLDALKGEGYIPILAHAERYTCLHDKDSWFISFINGGGVVQLNASSVLGSWGKTAKRQWLHLVKEGFVRVIASDGHDPKRRPPQMSGCIKFLKKYCGEEEIRFLMWKNAWRIVHDLPIE